MVLYGWYHSDSASVFFVSIDLIVHYSVLVLDMVRTEDIIQHLSPQLL